MGQGVSRKMIQDAFETIKGEMIAQTIVIAVNIWMNFESSANGNCRWVGCGVRETVESRTIAKFPTSATGRMELPQTAMGAQRGAG